ncbi:hypothetical protein U2A4042630001 [Corynebacterium striatum]|nr:hypothetical protein U2A4042630001 [Corynebacterium striatum]
MRHNGRIVRSTHKGLNHWEPSAHGVDEHIWLDITDRYTTPPARSTGHRRGATVCPRPRRGGGRHHILRGCPLPGTLRTHHRHTLATRPSPRPFRKTLTTSP